MVLEAVGPGSIEVVFVRVTLKEISEMERGVGELGS